VVEHWDDFVRKQRDEYKKSEPASCPVFHGELVYFNSKGFSHLLRKGHALRKVKEAYRKLILLKYARRIILSATEIYKYAKYEHSGVQMWVLRAQIDGKMIDVVVRQDHTTDRKYFFSIMSSP
jgi:hypothetical protein